MVLLTGYGLCHPVLCGPTNWLNGSSRGLVVKVLDSKFKGCEFKTHTVRFRSLGNFVYPTLPQSTQLQMSTNTVWKVPAMD